MNLQQLPPNEISVLKQLEAIIGRTIPPLTNLDWIKYERYGNGIGFYVENGHVKNLILYSTKEETYKIEVLPDSITELIHLKKLILGGNSLKELPDSLAKLDLIYLGVRSNNLTTLPESIGELKSLKKLLINFNKLEKLPDSIGELSELEELDLSGNKLLDFPLVFETLKNLRKLNLSLNTFHEIPDIIGEFEELKDLDLSSCKINSLSENIGKLKSLENLYLQENNLSSLPETIGNLSLLRVLILRKNNIKELLPTVGKMTSLRQLNLVRNKLKTLPITFQNLVALEDLNLAENELSEIPKGIKKLKSLKKLDLSRNIIENLEGLKGLINLNFLDIRNNRINDLGEIKGFNLNEVQLSENFEIFKHNYLLKELYLQGNPLKNLYNQVFQKVEKVALGEEMKVTFFVGAGISMPAPSSLPSAGLISETLLNLFAIKDEIQYIGPMRYEVLIEEIQSNFDPNLRFLDYFDLFTLPNIIHFFLANRLIRGSTVITTNHDYLIEYALMSLLPSSNKEKIIPIITKNDFENLEYNKDNHYIFKIHGSKKNIITGENTNQSIVSSTRAFGKGRKTGETFALEDYKEKIFKISEIRENLSTLVVMGYSGSDDFDISPTLEKLKDYNKVIWVAHSKEKKPKISQINRKKVMFIKELNPKDSFNSLSGHKRFLTELAERSSADIFLVRIDTSRFLQLLGFDTKKLREQIDFERKSNLPTFTEWLEKEFQNINIFMRYLFTSSLLFKVRNLERAIICSQKAIEIAENENNVKALWLAKYNLGSFLKEKRDYELSKRYFQEALDLAKEKEDMDMILKSALNLANIYKNLGSEKESEEILLKYLKEFGDVKDQRLLSKIYTRLGDLYEKREIWNRAIEYYQKSLSIFKKYEDISGISRMLTIIANNYITQKDYMNAKSFLQEAIKANETAGDLSNKAFNYSNYGEVLHDEGKIDEAMAIYEDAVKIYNFLGHIKDEATVITKIMYLCYYKNDKERLAKYSERFEYLKEKLAYALQKIKK